MNKTIILSGGMDSVTLLYYLLKDNNSENIKAISINYGQKHKKELEYAKQICKLNNVSHKIADLSLITELISSSVLTSDNEVPEGHYEQSNMSQTVVPNRNAIMLAVAYGYAITNKSDTLYYGAHAGDHFIYPDCRNEFVKAIDSAFYIGNLNHSEIDIKAPFIKMSKTEITKIGLQLNVPYELTWSCYKGQDKPCGKCGTCVERTEAFYMNSDKDPSYDNIEWQKAINYYLTIKK